LRKKLILKYENLRSLADFNIENLYTAYNEVVKRSSGDGWRSLEQSQKDTFLHFKMRIQNEETLKVDEL